MPSPYYYYVYPFGQNADDLTSIPTNAAGDGSVSYYAGWTDPYEYNLLTNPAALPIPRGQMNQLFFDITNNLQQYQQYGTPIWVTGNTVSYPIYARVYYSGQVYENQISNNTNTPGTDSTWLVISGNNGGVPIGTVIDFASPIIPTDYLLCDGAAYSRSTYAALLATLVQGMTGILTATSPNVTGLSSTSNLYVGMPMEGFGIPLGTTILSISSGTSVVMSNNASSSGTPLIVFYSWGNGNGSTTFNVPNLQRSTTIGSGGSGTAIIGNSTGQQGGEEAHVQTVNELATHNHSFGTHQSSATAGAAADTFISGQTINNVYANPGVPIFNTGSSQAFNVMQPSTVMSKCIKYK